MAMINETELKNKTILKVAELMAVAARTAPKARGTDNLEIAIATEETIEEMAGFMKKYGKKNNVPFFIRDAECILKSPAVVLIGTYIKTQGLDCGLCGYEKCSKKDKHKETPCIFNSNDLGIALGSAVSVASNHHIDNRIMYSAGIAALKLKLFKKEVKIIFAIPLSATSKNPFFDRPAVQR